MLIRPFLLVLINTTCYQNMTLFFQHPVYNIMYKNILILNFLIINFERIKSTVDVKILIAMQFKCQSFSKHYKYILYH